MFHIKDQDHDLVVADFVQDPPITGTHSPGPRIPDKLCGLSWPGIVREPVNHASHLLADRGQAVRMPYAPRRGRRLYKPLANRPASSLT